MNLGAVLLRRWRGERTQVQASLALGIDQGRYSMYERGLRRPGRTTALQIQARTDGDVPIESWDAEHEQADDGNGAASVSPPPAE